MGMNRMKSLVLLLLALCLTIGSHGQNQEDLDEMLKALDSSLDHREEYTEARVREIAQIRTGNSEISPWWQSMMLSEAYLSYDVDSALYYGLKSLEVIEVEEERKTTQIQLVNVYSLVGMYAEAGQLLRELQADQLPDSLKMPYYSAAAGLFRNMDGYLPKQGRNYDYGALVSAYQDSLRQTITPEDVFYATVQADYFISQSDLKRAESVLRDSFEQGIQDERLMAITAFSLSSVYEMQGKSLAQMYYLALSAKSDIQGGIRENTALRNLAVELYDRGEVERAYRYIKVALGDALFSNSLLRTQEVLASLPLIDGAYQQIRQEKQDNMMVYLLTSGMLSLFLILAIAYIYKQTQKLVRVNQRIEVINAELESSNEAVSRVNQELLEANHVQEEYIAKYLKLCSDYIGKFDNYRHHLLKLLTMEGKKELERALKSKEYTERELKAFYNDFDHAFLQMHPGFVGAFNDLLQPEYKVVPKNGELMNTELRIFALVRMGITDSAEIAEFLRYSISTIYNYRTRTRNKAKGARDEFEQKVARIA